GDALACAHGLPPPQAREASAGLIAARGEKLDAMDPSRLLVVGATSRTDALDPALVAPGRLDRLVEVTLPDAAAQREILELMRARTEKNADRALFETLDYRSVLPI